MRDEEDGFTTNVTREHADEYLRVLATTNSQNRVTSSCSSVDSVQNRISTESMQLRRKIRLFSLPVKASFTYRSVASLYPFAVPT